MTQPHVLRLLRPLRGLLVSSSVVIASACGALDPSDDRADLRPTISACEIAGGTCGDEGQDCPDGTAPSDRACDGEGLACCVPTTPAATACEAAGGTCDDEGADCPEGTAPRELDCGGEGLGCCAPAATACEAVGGTCGDEGQDCPEGTAPRELDCGGEGLGCCAPASACEGGACGG
jgi:hypothetical protein